MCDGCWFGDNGCGGDTKAFALPPANGLPQGQQTTPDEAISKADARISVAYCAQQMKDAIECSTEYIGVADDTGHCWCAKEGGNCDTNTNIKDRLLDTVNGGFFRSKLEAHPLARLLHARCLTHKH